MMGTAALTARWAAGMRAREVLGASRGEGGWSLEGLAGRFVEIGGGADSAALSTTAGLIQEAQRRGELAAWVGSEQSVFYPPDFAASGIDLSALPVVRTGEVRAAARVADMLLRSGSFALVVIDLGNLGKLPVPVQARLVGLAKKHHAALLCITRDEGKPANRGSLVSLRVQTTKTRRTQDGFQCALEAVKDKRQTPGWCYTENCHGPGGLC